MNLSAKGAHPPIAIQGCSWASTHTGKLTLLRQAAMYESVKRAARNDAL